MRRTMPLVDVIREIQQGNDALYRARRAVCEACEFVNRDFLRREGRIKCRQCGCHDPARMRPRCPVGFWGVTPIAACAHYVEGDRCALGHLNCNGCPDRQERRAEARRIGRMDARANVAP